MMNFFQKGCAYTFCSSFNEDGSMNYYNGIFHGYEYVGRIKFIKIFRTSLGNTILVNPSNLLSIGGLPEDSESSFNEVLVTNES